MSAAYQRILDALRVRGSSVQINGSTVKAQCPAHDDRNPSLSITDTESRVLVHCHAGCDTAAVLVALDLTLRDLYDQPRGDTLATYIYPGGRRVHRKADKSFPQSGNTKTDRSLFHADRIGDARVVFVAEGEEDVFAIESAGGMAVCPAMGAGKAHLPDWSVLDGRHVIVVADADEPGRKHAIQIGETLRGLAATVSLVEPAAGFKDASEHLGAGKIFGEFVPVAGDGGEPSPGPTSGGGDGQPRLWSATDLKPSAQPRWLAKSRIPFAAVSLLVGDEGIGKSLLWVWIVAAVTTGKPLPGFGIPTRNPSPVILVVTEDGWQDTVLPRLQVAGADLNMIEVICTEADGSGAPVFPRDLHLIDQADPAPAIIVVDAWLDTVPSRLSVKDPQQARQALHPWKETATKTDAAVLLICHTNRVSTANPRDRYGVTGELRKKARMTLYAQKADDDSTLIVGPEKANGARTVAASQFTVTSERFWAPTDEHDGTVPLLTYLGESAQTAREHLADSVADRDGNGGDAAVDWLATFLADGPRWSVEVHDARKVKQITEQKLRAAKLKLNVKSGRAAGDGPWFMALPQHSGRQPGDQAPVQGSESTSVSDIWTSGDLRRSEQTTGDPTPRRLSSQADVWADVASTSQDSLNANGETWRRRATPGLEASATPPCVVCGNPVTAGQRNAAGRPAHLGCQQT